MASDDPRQALYDLLDRSAGGEVFPGCVAIVWGGGGELYHEAHGLLATHPMSTVRGHGIDRATLFDLASLTKVLATTTLAAIAVGEGRVELDTPLPEPFTRACPGAKLGDLLSHSAGLVAHREYFADFAGRAPVGPGPILERIMATPPAGPPGVATIYSDLGFVLLGAWLERLFDVELDRLFADRIAWPLGLDRRPLPRIGYHRLGELRGPTGAEEGLVAPTEVYDPALHTAGEPSYFAVRRPAPCAHYEVHDDNAFAMGGVAGHAGLFGDADAVLAIARAWVEGGLPGLGRRVRERFLVPSPIPGSTRRLGWDGVSEGGSTGGALSPAAFG
ncbi:MAG: beta-lactamase family protein, partial [Myxococcales bacterium]|nr:beta-lactamase family protein [Myxococcales bacterium]